MLCLLCGTYLKYEGHRAHMGVIKQPNINKCKISKEQEFHSESACLGEYFYDEYEEILSLL